MKDDLWVSSTALYTKSAVQLLQSLVLVKPKGESYWTEKYPDLNFEKIWKRVYYGFKSFCDADIDFKIRHNVLFTNHKLYFCKMIDSPLCTFCKTEIETTFHLFLDCNVTYPVWKKLIDKLSVVEASHDEERWKKVTLFGNYEAKTNKPASKQSDLLSDFLLNCYKNVVWSSRVSVINLERPVDIERFFHSSVKQKLIIVYNSLKSKDQLGRFWETFSQNDIPTSCGADNVSYVYTLDL